MLYGNDDYRERRLYTFELGESQAAFNSLFGTYKNTGAKSRGHSFELTAEQFYALTQGECWLCGCKPAQIHRPNKSKSTYVYNGIDRVDNAIGYTETNCLPCCGTCNKLKGAKDVEEFIQHIRRISRNLNLR